MFHFESQPTKQAPLLHMIRESNVRSVFSFRPNKCKTELTISERYFHLLPCCSHGIHHVRENNRQFKSPNQVAKHNTLGNVKRDVWCREHEALQDRVIFISSVAWLHVLTSSIVTKLNLHDNPCSKRDMRATNQSAQFGWGLLKSIYRYGKVLTRRMCLIIKSSLV